MNKYEIHVMNENSSIFGRGNKYVIHQAIIFLLSTRVKKTIDKLHPILRYDIFIIFSVRRLQILIQIQVAVGFKSW